MTQLTAGPATAELDGVDLRDVRWHGVEVARRVYVAVRDPDWCTIQGTADDIRIEQGADTFRVTFTMRHVDACGIDFAWRGTLEGSASGVVRSWLDGVCNADFEHNRIGFCVLHPDDECAGQRYRATTEDGSLHGRLPQAIFPQRFEHGTYLPLAGPLSELSIDLRSGGRATFSFAGDLFEIEDQRNWTDASFKTYCTPLRLGFPHRVRRGQAIRQSVEIAPARLPAAGRPAPAETVMVDVGAALGTTFPAIGLGMSSDGVALEAHEAALLRLARPSHLRADVRLHDPALADRLAAAHADAEALGCQLELALFADGATAERAAVVTQALPPRALARVLVFADGARSAEPNETTPAKLAAAVRRALGDRWAEIPVGGGTDIGFCELNRTQPPVAVLDEVCYPIMPQEHAFDDRSLVETLPIQAATVHTARSFAGDRPIGISPVTLRPRYNAVATSTDVGPASVPPSPEIDPRQRQLFAAAWTIGSLKHLADAGAAWVTLFETVGRRGLLERTPGVPRASSSLAGRTEVFPLLPALAGLAEWRGAAVLRCTSADPRRVVALAVRSPDRSTRMVLANVGNGPTRCTIAPVDADAVRVRRLDAAPGVADAAAVQRWLGSWEQAAVAGGALGLTLAPHAVVSVACDR